jgi:uracil-DNA glycosylase family 4
MTEDIVSELQRIVRAHRELDADAHGPLLRPVLPCGPRDAAICFVGRDPGAKEAECGLPFVGESGQRLRDCLLETFEPSAVPGEQSRLRVGEKFFWMNTVPFKPKGNKPWTQSVRIACQPMLLQLMQAQWGGRDVVTFGKEAFLWFGIGQSRDTGRMLRAFWNQGGIKYERSIDVPLPALERTVCLHPVPHPSSANARWKVRFPELFKQRLLALG